MIKISELKKLEVKYYERSKRLLEKDSISGFITFINKEQSKRGCRVVSWERRQTAGRLKELEKRQDANKPFDPEDDFKNLKD